MNITIQIPSSLSDITLGQYQKWSKVSGDDDFRARKMIEIFCSVDLAHISKMRYVDIQDITSHLIGLFEEPLAHTRVFKLKDTKYGFIPNLEDITFGEFTDIDEFVVEWDTMHKAMAVMYRAVIAKVGEHYTIDKYNALSEHSEIVKEMPINIVLGALNFMLRLGIELSRATLQSLETEIKMDSQTYLNPEGSLNVGVGSASIIPSLTEMQQGLMKLATLTSTLRSLSSPLRLRKPKLKPQS